MRLGDRVMSRKTGLPASGIVIAMWRTGEDYATFSCTPLDIFYNWFDLYPNWADKEVILVKYDSPQKPVSRNELRRIIIELLGCVPNDDIIDFEYSKIPQLAYSAYPIEDLEIWD